jgi:hypothetical protein
MPEQGSGKENGRMAQLMSDPGPGYCPGGSRSTRAHCVMDGHTVPRALRDGWSHSSAHCVMGIVTQFRALCDGWSHSSADCVMDGYTVPRTL